MNTDFEALLKPVSAESPAGEWLRGKEIYRKIEAALEEDLSGSAHGGVLIRARPEECAALAIEALSTRTKDLAIAVWLAEALVRIDGFDGLRRALDLIRGLLAGFWETVYPLPDGDEELRAAPVAKLTGKAFSRVISQMIPITRDGYTRLDEEILKSIPTLDKTGSSDTLAKARLEAEAKKRVLPESFAASLRATDFDFYKNMSVDIVSAREAATLLERECETRFTDPAAVPRLDSLASLFDPYIELSAEMMRQKAPPSQAQQPSTPAPALPVPEVIVTREAPIETPTLVAEQPAAANSLIAIAEVSADPVTADEAARRVFASARFLRGQNPTNPAAFLLPRCWHFGAVIGRGSLDAADLEPPPPELRKELWGLHVEKDWAGLLEKVEEAMELRCATSWLDLHYYSGMALENLGDSYLAASKMTRALVLEYITLVPGLSQEQLLDGTPAASPAAARWLESLRLAEENYQEQRTEPLDSGTETPTDSFDVALRLAGSGRIGEALQVFYDNQQPDDTGRRRFESRLRIARLCIAARQHPLALPLLREARREIGHWRLEEWDPDLSVRALAMLHECLAASGALNEEIADVFARICIIDPLLAIKLGDRR